MVKAVLGSLGVPEGDEPLCVRFVNTVGSRRTSSPNEYLATPAHLAKWIAGNKLTPDAVQVDAEFHGRALHLRNSLYRIFSAVAAERLPEAGDIEALNSELCEALAKLEITAHFDWTLDQSDPLDRALMLIALSAADLLTSSLAPRIRECADEGCGWIFVDRSKNRTRRWCSMSDCGNLAKARRFQAKKQASAAKEDAPDAGRDIERA